jgi:HKD family nuclease
VSRPQYGPASRIAQGNVADLWVATKRSLSLPRFAAFRESGFGVLVLGREGYVKTRYLVQGSATGGGRTVAGELDRLMGIDRYERIGLAVAYATVSGLRVLIELLDKRRSVTASKWLFGLDDCFTQPAAITLAASLPGADVRVARMQVTDGRFHPKVLFLSSPDSAVTLIVGSPNLTRDALLHNVEAVAISRATRRPEARMLLRAWRDTWSVGHTPTSTELDRYQEEFNSVSEARSRLERERSITPETPGGEILSRDSAMVDPALATVCWIEVGNITGFKQEQLEIKAEQALFFGLRPTGGADTTVTVQLPDRRMISIPVKYRHNAMWRFNLPDAIPEVARGLRPGGKRSPFVAVFTRASSGQRIQLKFIRRGEDYRAIERRSTELGTLGSTSARLYGWY